MQPCPCPTPGLFVLLPVHDGFSFRLHLRVLSLHKLSESTAVAEVEDVAMVALVQQV